MDDIEIDITRFHPVSGQAVHNAAVAAQEQREITYITADGERIAVIAPMPQPMPPRPAPPEPPWNDATALGQAQNGEANTAKWAEAWDYIGARLHGCDPDQASARINEPGEPDSWEDYEYQIPGIPRPDEEDEPELDPDDPEPEEYDHSRAKEDARNDGLDITAMLEQANRDAEALGLIAALLRGEGPDLANIAEIDGNTVSEELVHVIANIVGLSGRATEPYEPGEGRSATPAPGPAISLRDRILAVLPPPSVFGAVTAQDLALALLVPSPVITAELGQMAKASLVMHGDGISARPDEWFLLPAQHRGSRRGAAWQDEPEPEPDDEYDPGDAVDDVGGAREYQPGHPDVYPWGP